MRINHNIAALNTYRQLGAGNNMAAKSMEKLSSGLRINRAGDDAAGLAISEKMRGQIRGLEQASRNAQDGISLIQTAEGALNETHSILQRMRELAVQASSDTNTDTDRSELQKELNQLVDEIDRIASTTEFNTKKLLNGQVSVQTASNNDAISVKETSAKTQDGIYAIDYSAFATKAKVGNADAAVSKLTADASITINGTKIDLLANDTLGDVVNKINTQSAKTGITATTGDKGGLVLITNERGSDQTLSVTASNQTLRELGLIDNAGADMDTTTTSLSAIGKDATGFINGAVAYTSGNEMSLVNTTNSAEGLSVDLTLTETAAKTAAVDFTTQIAKGAYGFNINGVDFSFAKDTAIQTAIDLINEKSATTGAQASLEGGNLVISSVLKGEDASLSVVEMETGTITVNNVASVGGTGESFTLSGVKADGTAGSAVVTFAVGADRAAQLAAINALTETTGVYAVDNAAGTAIELRTVGFGDIAISGYALNGATTPSGFANGTDAAETAATGAASTITAGAVTETVGASAYSEGTFTITDTATDVVTNLAGVNNGDQFTVQGVKADGTAGTAKQYTIATGDTIDDIIAAINADSDVTGVKASAVDNGTTVTLKLETVDTGADAVLTISEETGTPLSGATGFNMSVGTIKNGADGTADGSVTVSNDNVLKFQIGANSGQNMNVDINDMGAKALGIDQINILTADSADQAITTINDAVEKVSAERSKLGAYQNRLEHTINNLGTSAENLTASESRIRDVDMAKEMMEFTKNNILTQAAQAMLAQANQLPQGVLQLLR